MNMSYVEWRTKSIQKMTTETNKRIKEYKKLGINGGLLVIILETAIENLHTKETLIHFLNNTEKCIKDLKED